jgi:hypothetical protein
VINTPQASGQSCGHAAWTTCFMSLNYMGASPCRDDEQRQERTDVGTAAIACRWPEASLRGMVFVI